MAEWQINAVLVLLLACAVFLYQIANTLHAIFRAIKGRF